MRGKEERLAFLRRENAMWIAVNPDAETWDVTFLLNVIDELRAKIAHKGAINE